MTDVLLLAGTAEARALAERLAAHGLDACASLAGVTRDPAPLALPTRRGGFGGTEGLAAWLRAEGIRAVIDATHPFAAVMQENARCACAAASVPRLRLLRPPWPDRPGWTVVGSAGEAAAALPAGASAFLTTGRKDLAPFRAREDCRFALRTIEPVADLPTHVTPLRFAPPVTRREERALMRRMRFTHLVTKNAGGTGVAKLDAADEVGLKTIVIARPPPPPGPTAETPAAAVAWLERTLDVTG